MKRLRSLRATMAGAALAGLCACNALVGIEEGSPYDGELCSTLADCAATVDVPDCRQARACERGRCVFVDAAEGTQLAEQTQGDCVELVCDGAGSVKQVAFADDMPDDGRACTIDTCVGTKPVHELRTWLPCYSGPAGSEGKGTCIGGVQHCDAEGHFVGGCEGEVLPQPESCISPLDEDCDGQVNEEGDGCAAGHAMAPELRGHDLQERARLWR